MQMSMARDVAYMARGQWNRIAFAPPVQPDTEQFLRLINGSINKTLIGVVWLLSGRDPATLPGIFAWAMPMDWNREQGNIPSDDAIHLARLPSAVLAALGVIPVFLIGWQMRLRSLAYPAALLYALHPVILLNGRRAMMEGSLLLTTLLTICWLLAMIIAEHSATAQGFVRRLSLPLRYAILGLLVGLAIAAKHTGLVVAGAALIGALLAALARDRSWRPLALVGLATAIAFLTWFALNPAYWNDPVGAAQATLNARADLLQSQAKDAPLAYNDIGQRVSAIIKQSFLTPPQYYESPTWSGVPLVEGQIALYQQSAIDGWDWGPLVGIVLTFLAALGLLTLLYDALRRDLVALAILIWAGATIAASLAIPLDWQRYYLPLLLVAIVLAAAGLGRLLVRRTADDARQQTVADATGA
jgi:4-amino-4-deoxy-L-arabinose transferase-like glycosyltransferase